MKARIASAAFIASLSLCPLYAVFSQSTPSINPPDILGAYQRGARAAQEQRAREIEIEQAREELRRTRMENEKRDAESRAQQQPSTSGPNVSSDPARLNPEQTRFLEAIKYRRFRWPDFDSVAFAPDVPISNDMIGLMAESRYAADIAYFLGKHKDKAAAISRMQLPEAAKAIREIEASVGSAPQ